ncbi:hypothetical protein N431DRAFT_357094 [Stipitochalara longipes BDJ]|nr:hypothetical protein N431DRAFT_357094 [Stipitochalara longipes BDJ]
MNTNPRIPIQLSNKLANRFYGPIILLSALNDACVDSRPVKFPDLSFHAEQSPERAFHDFVNKLAQLCDIERGGKTVTALAVLKYPDHIQYRFTSNQRKSVELDRTQEFITSILFALGKAEEPDFQHLTSNILRKSLSFTRPRVEPYVKALKKEVISCIGVCGAENTDESRSILEALQKLQGKLLFSSVSGLNDDEFSQNCESLLKYIDDLYKSDIEFLIRSRTREGRMNKSEGWSELRHMAGRLLSYLQAVKTLVSTRKLWPELFLDYKVCYTASSIPGRNTFLGKNSPEKISADRIIGCMTADPAKMAEYRAHAQELQKCGLDESIRTKTSKQRFLPIVHAEVLLLNWLESDGGTHPSRFFNSYKYIGCSKPTCRLCEHYFTVHASGVKVRAPHRNLYTNWRMPDVYGDQGPRAVEDRKELIDKMLQLVRNDAFRVLVERIPEGKRHDSNTDPTYPIGSISSRRTMNGKHLEASFKSLNLDSPDDDAISSSTNSNWGGFSPESDDNDDNDDDDNGGVKI